MSAEARSARAGRPIGHLRFDDVDWISLGIEGAGLDRFGNAVAEPASEEIRGGSGFAAGFVDFQALEMDFTVTYDEVCYVIEGEIHLRRIGEEAELVVRAGEAFHIVYGTDVHVRVHDTCRIFYAAYPVDWWERHEDERARLGR